MDILKTQAKDYLQRIPLIEKESLKKKYGIMEATLENHSVDAEYKNSQDMLLADVHKNTLHNLCFDTDIASVEEYIEPKPCATCVACQRGSGDMFQNPPCFTTLASSAYNPASAMPSNAKGQGVNAATWESGLRTAYINCINLGSHLKHYDVGYNNEWEIAHSEQTFRCVTNAAPQANFYHMQSYDFSTTTSENNIYNWGIQTVSRSMGNTTDPLMLEMRHIDMWAYKWPYTVFCNPTANDGYCLVPNWGCYNAINVGNVQHSNESHYVMVDSSLHCQFRSGTTQTANPPPRYGAPVLNYPFDCSSCIPGDRADRELPMIVAPGIGPILWDANWNPVPPGQGGMSIMSDPCIDNDSGTAVGCEAQGTSYSAPITNGIAACVISSDSRMIGWPEKVRAVLLATAQNVDFNYWNYLQDGRDGAGVISGSDAVWLARNHVAVSPGSAAVPYGICAGSLSSGASSANFNISIPNPKPSGKHLRIVLTWDSSPSLNDDVNDLSDLDLRMNGNNNLYYSNSWGSNVEMIDVPSSDLTVGNSYAVTMTPWAMRIPSDAFVQFIYYAVAWTWVKNHAS